MLLVKLLELFSFTALIPDIDKWVYALNSS